MMGAHSSAAIRDLMDDHARSSSRVRRLAAVLAPTVALVAAVFSAARRVVGVWRGFCGVALGTVAARTLAAGAAGAALRGSIASRHGRVDVALAAATALVCTAGPRLADGSRATSTAALAADPSAASAPRAAVAAFSAAATLVFFTARTAFAGVVAVGHAPHLFSASARGQDDAQEQQAQTAHRARSDHE